jgi:hypothetical protein
VQLELAQHELKVYNRPWQQERRRRIKRKYCRYTLTALSGIGGGAKWWSPSSKKEADARDAAFEAYQQQVEAEKATRRELQQTQKLLREKQQQQKLELREKEKEERARLNAVKAAAVAERKANRERQKQARNAEKSI